MMTLTHTEPLMPAQRPKWVGQALSLIAAAVVMVALGAVAAVALVVAPPPPPTQVVRPAATHAFSIPGPARSH